MRRIRFLAVVIVSAFARTLVVDSPTLEIRRKAKQFAPVSLDVAAASSPQNVLSSEPVLEDAGDDLSPVSLDVAGISNPQLFPAPEAVLKMMTLSSESPRLASRTLIFAASSTGWPVMS